MTFTFLLERFAALRHFEFSDILHPNSRPTSRFVLP